MFIEILFKIVLFKGGVLIYAKHCIMLGNNYTGYKMRASEANILGIY